MKSIELIVESKENQVLSLIKKLLLYYNLKPYVVVGKKFKLYIFYKYNSIHLLTHQHI